VATEGTDFRAVRRYDLVALGAARISEKSISPLTLSILGRG